MSGPVKVHNYSELLIAIASIFFSSLIINVIIKRGYSFDYLIFTIEDIKRTLSLPIVSSCLILFLKRIKQVLLIIILMKFIKPDFLYRAIIALLGVLYGTLMSVQANCGGIYYAGIFIISILPHYIIYFMCIDLIYKFYMGRVFNKNKVQFISIIVMLTICGVLLEENFLRIFLS